MTEEKEIDLSEIIDEGPIVPPGNISQHTLLSYLMANPEVWTIVEPIIKPEYFEDEFKPVVRLILEHVDEYKILPSIPIIRMKTGKLLDKYDNSTDPRIANWLTNEIEEFCRHSATLLEIQRAYQVVSKDRSRAALEEIYKNIKTITEISVNKDLGIEVHLDARKQLEKPQSVNKRTTGYQHFDQALMGGLPSPGMFIIAGRSGYGKSVNLANFGINYCEQGDFVVYVSLEMDIDRIWDRIGAMMIDIPARHLRIDKTKSGDLIEHRLQLGDGLYAIKKLPKIGTTVSHLNAYLKELTIKMGRKPTVLILDYIQCLWPKTKIRDMGDIHIKDKFVVEELYDLCSEWDMLCLTASQLVKDNQEHNMFDHSIMAGGRPLMDTTDVAVTFQRKDDIVWFNIIKGRDGGEGISVPLCTNIETLRLSDASDEIFYERNPRLNPNYSNIEGLKLGHKEKVSINRDVQLIQNDNILERLLKIHTLDDDDKN